MGVIRKLCCHTKVASGPSSVYAGGGRVKRGGEPGRIRPGEAEGRLTLDCGGAAASSAQAFPEEGVRGSFKSGLHSIGCERNHSVLLRGRTRMAANRVLGNSGAEVYP